MDSYGMNRLHSNDSSVTLPTAPLLVNQLHWRHHRREQGRTANDCSESPFKNKQAKSFKSSHDDMHDR